jgi:putative oxygen-independent coproporphyrinogen III oxidase
MAGVYIHIPFCKKFCSYCDFYHIEAPVDFSDFISALFCEAEKRSDYLGNEKVSTIYIGGGTPSVMPVNLINRMLEKLGTIFSVEEGCEITVELNPDDIDNDFIRELKATPVNRVSLGIQSWNDRDLKLLGRRHNAAQAEAALEQILSAGYSNLTIDLIYGIPGTTSHDWASNLEKSFTFDIKHLSAYHLSFEPGTLLWKMKEKGQITEIDEEESSSQFNLLIEMTAAAGFTHYEISNFCKPGYLSLHNSNYWKQVNYLGLGPSAHSFNGFSRQWNVRDVKKYMKAVISGSDFHEGEELDRKTRFNEYIMTSLRTMWGIDLDLIESRFEKEGYDYIVNLSAKFINYGLMNQVKNTLVLTNQGKMISDNIISELMLP